MIRQDPIKIPSTMSWDQIPKYVSDVEEERYQNLKPLFFPGLKSTKSNSSHEMEDYKMREMSTEDEVQKVEMSESNPEKEILNIKTELRKQGNVKLTGFSPNQMKKRLAKINKAGTIPPPPPTRPGEEEVVPPPPPFKPPCNDKCCDKVGKKTMEFQQLVLQQMQFQACQ